MIPAELRQLTDSFFAANAHRFDMRYAEGCGKYMEELVPYAQSHGYPKVGHLKKSGSQTQYNGHAIDAFLYKDTVTVNGLMQAVDVIGSAETDHATAGWSVDFPRYTEDDWMESVETPTPNTVPWVGYNEEKFQFLKRQLAYDYARRPQGADFDVCVWAARTFHNSYMGPEGVPLGETAGMERAQKEWCAALGVPVKAVPPGWNIGDPV